MSLDEKPVRRRGRPKSVVRQVNVWGRITEAEFNQLVREATSKRVSLSKLIANRIRAGRPPEV